MKIPITLFLCLLSVELLSQVLKDTLSTTELPEIVITASGFLKRSNLNTSISYLPTEQIALTHPEKITDGLTFLPGIYSVPDGGLGGQTLNVRGFEQNRVNIFFNGIPLRSNAEGRINIDGFFFTNADISVEKGTASLIYGANSSGNVIRIDNRIFLEEKIGIKINSYLGTNGKKSFNGLITGNIKKKIHFQASANLVKSNSFLISKDFETVPSQMTRERVNSDQENVEIISTITYTPNKNHHFSLTGMHNERVFGYAPSTSYPRFRRMDYWKNSIVGLRNISSFGNKISLETNFYFTFLNDTINDYKDNTFTKVNQFSHWKDKTTGARGILSYQFTKQHQLSYSIDYKNDIHNQTWVTTATTKIKSFLSAVEYRGTFSNGISLNAGSSFNLYNPVNNLANSSIARKDLSEWNYQLSTAYSTANLKHKIHAGYSRTSIFPRMLDLFGDVLMGYSANPDLISETSNNVDAGVSSLFFDNQLTIQLGGYYSPVKNLITTVKATETTYKIINLKSAVLAGGEFMLKYSPNDNVFAIISYSFLNAKNTSANRTSDYIAYRPKNQLKTFLSYMPVKYLGFDLTYTAVSKRYYDNQTIWHELPGYSLVDFGITSKPIQHLTCWLKAYNLLDKNFVSAFDQPQPGREFRLGLSFQW